MKTSDYDYFLPPDAIAQHPLEPRDSSRLMVLHRNSGSIEHEHFYNIISYLQPGDLLVLNKTRVIPARILGHKQSGGRVELLLLRREDSQTWECLVGGKGLTEGKQINLDAETSSPSAKSNRNLTGGGLYGLRAEIIENLDGSRRRVRFSEPIEPYFSKLGHVPLPPYIHENLADPERYQTVYAKDPGSAAAPTAGLHFTQALLEKLLRKGIDIAYVTLHVGLDTFAPVLEASPLEHKIHSEWCEISSGTAQAINRTRLSGGRIIAVGTTTVRTLESADFHQEKSTGFELIKPFSKSTSVFILPGYVFKMVDAMVTNFHLPKSTLIMMVSAFAGRENILRSYQTAIENHYRFYSFGDAMLIL